MSGHKAFTILELNIVIVIIGVLAMLALPRFSATFEKMRLAEGIQILETLRNAQAAYWAENGSYSDTISALDVSMPSPANFNPITDAEITNDPANIAQVTRSTGTYTISIDKDGLITCTGAGTECAQVGCSKGAGNECN